MLQDLYDKKKSSLQLLTQGTIFLNNSRRHRKIYVKGFVLEIFICSTLLCFSALCLFYFLDNRFLTIGIKFLTDKESVDNIFSDLSHCRDPGFYSGGSKPGEKKTCHLNMNTFYKSAMVILWYLYLFGAIILSVQLVIKIVAIVTRQQKR